MLELQGRDQVRPNRYNLLILNMEDKKDISNNIRAEIDEELREYDRAECCRILGLPEDADDDAVKLRYGALLRQYKKNVDEYGATYEGLAYYNKITKAYDTVFGYSHDFSDDDPTSPIPYTIRRRFGRFATWFEQYKLAVLLVVVIVFLGVVFTVQSINKGKNDIKIKFVGAFSELPGQNVTKNLNARSEVFNNAQITFFTVTTDSSLLDPGARTGAEAFLAQLMAKGALDVVLIDKDSFDVYVQNKAFLPLDGLYERYRESHKDSYLLELYDYESPPDEKGDVLVEQGIYGIDITDTDFFDDTGLLWLYNEDAGQRKSMIFCVASKSGNLDAAYDFLVELLSHVKH